MLNFYKSKQNYNPVKPQGFEGIVSKGKIAFTNAERTWEESFDLVEILHGILQEKNFTVTHQNDWLIIDGLYLCPELVSFQLLEESGVNICTSIAIAHEKYAPEGLFEYQHASGDDLTLAIVSGFENWITIDLPALLDAVNNTQETCTAMDMELPKSIHRVRRVLLGPVLHFASQQIDVEEEHPFCPCCLLTNSFEAFKQQLEGEKFYGIRLLVIRNDEGEVSADCRVNGIDWDVGKEQLIKYGETWPERGFEMRKQYVVVYTKDA